MQLGETTSGYPTITLDPPLQPFAEFLRAAHSMQSATNISDAVAAVVDGKEANARIDQDCATLTLDGETGTARVWIDNLSKDIEETADMPLTAFRDVAFAWCSFLRDGATTQQ